jgi:uncharacterized paraquat-inducible protein A
MGYYTLTMIKAIAILSGIISIITFIIVCIMAKALYNISKNTALMKLIAKAQAEKEGMEFYQCQNCKRIYTVEHEECPDCHVKYHKTDPAYQSNKIKV